MSFRIPANLMAGELILTIGGMNANGNLMNFPCTGIAHKNTCS